MEDYSNNKSKETYTSRNRVGLSNTNTQIGLYPQNFKVTMYESISRPKPVTHV